MARESSGRNRKGRADIVGASSDVFIGLCNNYFCRIMTVKGETKDVSEKIQFGQCF